MLTLKYKAEDKLQYIISIKDKAIKERDIEQAMHFMDEGYQKQCDKVNRLLAKHRRLKGYYYGGNNTLKGIKY